jgi:hypothetical protein
MQNRSIFPYRRHGPKKRVKHGPNSKQRGPQKGLPNSARDLLPMLQPATKALAQVLAGRAGASGQLGHARTMLAQAERMIAERAHNRLTPAEREEFFEQLARLKLTLADADAEAEVQAGEQEAPRVQMPPVAHERLKEMALALAGRERPGQPSAAAGPMSTPASETVGEMVAREAAAQRAKPPEATEGESAPAEDAAPQADRGAATAAGGRDRLVLPKASADQVAQAVAFGGIARRRSRASSRGAMAAAAAATDEPAATTRAVADPTLAVTRPPAPPAATEPSPAPARFKVGVRARHGGHAALDEGASAATAGTPDAPSAESKAEPHEDAEAHRDNGAVDATAPAAKTARRSRKPKHRGLPEGWVIDDDGFVVPGAD